MRARQRPISQNGPPIPTLPAAARTTRRVFNCIVDDSALVAGVKKSTRNGIRQWVRTGQIRLFVPLHALEELSRQKNGKNKHAEDVRETLHWLDEATTKHPDVVALQGADETYEKWAEVERFSVPRTLFSENDHDLELETESCGRSQDHPNNFHNAGDNPKTSLSSHASNVSRSISDSSLKSVQSSVSPVSPPTSPAKAPVSPTKHMLSLAAVAGHSQTSSDSVPHALQPLFNYILWRVHQEMDPVAALETFIFLCNDTRKVRFAKGFDIKTKRLEQLREAVGREDRDHKNRQALLNRENEESKAGGPEHSEAETAAEEIIFTPSPPTAPAAMLPHKQQSSFMDPDAFDRGPHPLPSSPNLNPPNIAPKSPRGNHATTPRASPRAGHALPFAPRGNFRGGMRGNFRGGPRGRGGNANVGPGRGGLAQHKAAAVEDAASNGQIDPDSFARPERRGGTSGGRGGRKLWVPT